MGITGGLVVGLRGMIPPAFAGLALAYAGQLTGILQNTVRWASETESRFTSVQRMQTSLQVHAHIVQHLFVIKKPGEILK
jgi:ATP-binding cassette subfamily C (CFTR/MRP) protein 5